MELNEELKLMTKQLGRRTTYIFAEDRKQSERETMLARGEMDVGDRYKV